MKKFTHLFLSVCAVAALAGCSGKDGDPGPAGAAGPAGPSGQNLTGTLFGFVAPYDEYGNTLARSGVTVTLEGATPAVTATTNADGRYEFANLRNGTYNLLFTRTGLSPLRRIGVGHVGGDQPTFLGVNSLTAPSTTTIGSLALTGQTSTAVNFSVPFSNGGAAFGALVRVGLYISSTPGVTPTNGIFLTSFSNTSSPSNFGVSKSVLNGLGFASGTSVYVVACGMSTFTPAYTDPANGRLVYTGLGAPSNQVAFIVP